MELVIATFDPTIAFVRVDFPTFGRPTKVAKPERKSLIARQLSHNHRENAAPASIYPLGG